MTATPARMTSPRYDTRTALAHQFASGPVDQQHVLVGEWTDQYGPDMAKQLMHGGVALAIWPEDVAEFRALWSAPTVCDREIRAAVAALSDDQLRGISESLRSVFQDHPGEIGSIWQLAIDWAAEA